MDAFTSRSVMPSCLAQMPSPVPHSAAHTRLRRTDVGVELAQLRPALAPQQWKRRRRRLCRSILLLGGCRGCRLSCCRAQGPPGGQPPQQEGEAASADHAGVWRWLVGRS